ncbi:Ni/Fe hydrogenase subunit alpha [Candidatus Falkowbacteria bacterium]|nr:Ni/Fe hydrogenase subunit alpha [Candidatus Falkowbacteria bacterium]
MKIKIDHIAKIEGHAGFVADIVNGETTKAAFNVLEGSRLLEGILRDRKYSEVSQIAARICGICPVVHNLTSLKALEDALDVKVSKQTVLLRKLMMLGQIINSHALHVFFFSLSDFFGIENDLKLIEKYPEKTKQAVAIREFGNKIIEVIGGRSIHPLTPEVSGFIRLPKTESIKQIGEDAKKILPLAIELARFFAKLNYPNFERETKFISLTNKNEYAIYDGTIFGALRRHAEFISASHNYNEISKPSFENYGRARQVWDDKNRDIAAFMQKINEFQVAEDVVKRTTIDEKPYMVGAIARINNNHKQLNKEAKKILKASKIKLPSQNPFHNILAQVVETVHCLEEVQKLIPKTMSSLRTKRSNPAIPPRDCFVANTPRNDKMEGYDAIEAPRGTLFYFYEVGDSGLVKNCNIITPTAQNIARLEKDLKIWLPQLQNLSEKEIQDKIRMLVRAYDPCLTCATH